ncbi:MAG: hypothetical protein N2513_07485 [Deltaproteobacteria bacterium]|nr:hypothetical protein [Deltaproteobacteria bacterium]
MLIYAVIGRPVFHSKSPQIFRSLFQKKKINANYLAFVVDSAEEAIKVGKKIGISGLNVTSPYKEDILRYVDEREDLVKKVGAANTILFSGDKTFAFNTDVDGVRAALAKNGVEIEGKKVAILGAGGSAKAVAFFLSLYTSPYIFNRTEEKAKEIADLFRGRVLSLADKHKMRDMDVLIYCLPAGVAFEYEHFLKEGQVVLDANYVQTEKRRKKLEERGVKYIDGRDWLLFQAIYSIKHFLNVEISYKILENAAFGPRKRKKTLCLVGFMGSGKTTIGRLLAQKLGVEFVDTDEVIQAQEGLSIDRIFKEKGESYFRLIEERIVTQLINRKEGAVISLGGGSVLSKKVREFLKKKATTIWLWIDEKTVIDRTDGSGNRPLLSHWNIHKLIKERTPFYAETADILISTKDRTAHKISDMLKTEIEYGLNCD